MLKPRANAISRLLTNGGFIRANRAHVGFTVYQDGDTCKVYAPFEQNATIEAIIRRLELCEYAAHVERDTKANVEFVRVAARP